MQITAAAITAASAHSNQPLAITDAGAPFNNAKADLIDNVDFRVFKLLLSPPTICLFSHERHMEKTTKDDLPAV
jgi:hypothetical protein